MEKNKFVNKFVYVVPVVATIFCFLFAFKSDTHYPFGQKLGWESNEASIAKYKLPPWTQLGNSNYLTQISWVLNLFIFEKNYVSGEDYLIPRKIPSHHISTQSWCNYIGVIPCEIKTDKFSSISSVINLYMPSRFFLPKLFGVTMGSTRNSQIDPRHESTVYFESSTFRNYKSLNETIENMKNLENFIMSGPYKDDLLGYLVSTTSMIYILQLDRDLNLFYIDLNSYTTLKTKKECTSFGGKAWFSIPRLNYGLYTVKIEYDGVMHYPGDESWSVAQHAMRATITLDINIGKYLTNFVFSHEQMNLAFKETFSDINESHYIESLLNWHDFQNNQMTFHDIYDLIGSDDSLFTNIHCVPHTEFNHLIEYHFNRFKLSDIDPRASFKSRNMWNHHLSNVEQSPTFSTFVQTIEYWDNIHDFVKCFMKSNDAEVDDLSIDLIKNLHKFLPQGIDDFVPNIKSIQIEDITNVLTAFIYHATVYRYIHQLSFVHYLNPFTFPTYTPLKDVGYNSGIYAAHVSYIFGLISHQVRFINYYNNQESRKCQIMMHHRFFEFDDFYLGENRLEHGNYIFSEDIGI